MTILHDDSKDQTAEPQMALPPTGMASAERSANERMAGQQRPVAQRMAPRRQPVPRWAVMASSIWVAIAAGYILAYGGLTPSPWVIGGVIAGVATPLLVIWIVALMEMRAHEIDQLTGPVRRQLNALLAPGMAAESRVRRVTQLLSEQTDQLRQAAGVALEDSSAAMSALTRQSGELRRISSDAMLELGRVGKTAEQTLKHLQDALAQLNTQTGGEREKALALVTELEKHTRSVMAEVETLSVSYEEKLQKLNHTSGQLEARAKTLVGLTEGVEESIASAADASINDVNRLESLVAEVAQRSAAISHQLERPITSLESAASYLDRNMRQSQEMLGSATTNLKTIGDTVLTRASSLVENLSDRLSSLELVGAKLVSVSAATQADTGRYVEQIEAAATRMREQIEQGNANLREMLTDYEQIADRSIAHSESVVGRLETDAAGLSEALARSEGRFEELLSDVDARSARMEKSGRTATSSLEEARLILDSAQDSFAEQLERLSSLSTQLGQEIVKAEQGTAKMLDAGAMARDRAGEILAAGDQTRSVLDTVTDVLTAQQSSVRDLSASIAAQVDALTTTLSQQRTELTTASGTLEATSVQSREAMVAQLATLGSSTREAGAMLDRLNSQLEAQTAGVSAVADRVDGRLRALVATVQSELESFSATDRKIEAEQKILSDLIAKADQHMAGFNSGLVAAQAETVHTMDTVAGKLAALRAEVERAGLMLETQGSAVQQQQASLSAGATHVSSDVEALLGRMTTLTEGLGSAGLAVEAQGKAAAALMGQAEEALTASAARLLGEQQTAGMALAEIARELSRQQRALEELHSQTSLATSELTRQGEGVALSLAGVTAGMAASAEALQHKAQDVRLTVDAAADHFEQTGGLLEAGMRANLALMRSAEQSMQMAGQNSTAQAEAMAEQMVHLQHELDAVRAALSTLSQQGEKISLELYDQAARAVDVTAAIEGAGAKAAAASTALEEKISAVSMAAISSEAQTDDSVAALQRAITEMQSISQQGEGLMTAAASQLALASGALSDNSRLAENKLSAATQSLRLAADEIGEKLATAQAALSVASAGLSDEATAANTHIQAMQTEITTLQAGLEALGYRSDQLADAIAQQASRAEQSAGQIEAATAKADTAARQIQQRMSELGDVASQQQNILAELGEAIVATQNNLTATGSKAETQLRNMLADLAMAGETADQAVAQIIDRLGGAGMRIGTETAEAEQQLSAASEILRRVSSEFVERIADAETRLGEARSGLLQTGVAVEEQIHTAESGVRSLISVTTDADGALSQSSQQVARLASEVGGALGTLLQDMTRLEAEATQHTRQLEDMSGRVGSQLARVGEAGSVAVAQQEQLLATLTKAQDSFGDIGLQVNSVRDIVAQVADNATERLTSVVRLLDEQALSGGQAVAGFTARLQQSSDVAREQMGLVSAVADQVEQRLTSAVTAVESRRTALMQATDTTLTRLGVVNEGFAETVSRAEAVQTQLFDHVQQNEHMLGGLSRLSEATVDTIERTGQRMAMLAQQAAQDSSRLSSVAERIEQQQQAIRHSAEAAVAVLQSVQAQLSRSGHEGVDLIEASEAKMSDVLVAMTERMTSLTRQSEAMMQQFGDMVSTFSQSTTELQQNGQQIGRELLDVTGQMHTRALDLTASGQQFDRELMARLESLDQTKGHLQGYFDGFGRELADIDSRTNSALIDLDRRTGETFGKLQHGVERLAALPNAMEAAQGLLSTQVEAARSQIALLRSDLLDIGQQVELSVGNAAGMSGQYLANLRDIASQSRVSAEQLDQASQHLVQASSKAWDMIGQAAGLGSDNLSSLLNTLGGAHEQLGTITDVARQSIDALLVRVAELSQLVEASMTTTKERYETVSRDGFGTFEKLTTMLDDGAGRLASATANARESFVDATEQLEKQQGLVEATAQGLGERLSSVAVQLEALRDGLSGVEARLEFVEPAFGSQQLRLESFLEALDRTLNQVTSLQTQAKDLSREHLDMANQIQEQESRMLAVATQLEGSLGHVDGQLSGSVLVRLQQALEQVQQAEGFLGRLSSQATQVDGVLSGIRTSLVDDVKALEFAENGISLVAGRATSRMQEVGSALSTTLGQLQKGSQLSQAGLMQANEETQRLVVRLEQVRALIKNMMGAIGTDLTEWQADLKRKMSGLASEVAEQAVRQASRPAIAALPPLPPSLGQSLRMAPTPSAETASVPNSSQLATQALHAIAVDLYRVLHAEVPELSREMMPPSARRQPMTPEDSRAYTRTLLDQKPDALRNFVRQLYQANGEFKQYVERYLARFEAQYDMMVRGTDGVAQALRWRQSESGQLYGVLAKAVERRSAAAGVTV